RKLLAHCRESGIHFLLQGIKALIDQGEAFINQREAGFEPGFKSLQILPDGQCVGHVPLELFRRVARGVDRDISVDQGFVDGKRSFHGRQCAVSWWRVQWSYLSIFVSNWRSNS